MSALFVDIKYTQLWYLISYRYPSSREEHSLRVFGIRVLRTVFEHKRDEVGENCIMRSCMILFIKYYWANKIVGNDMARVAW